VIPSNEEKYLTSLSAGSPSTPATPMPKPPVPKKDEWPQSELLACIPPTTPDCWLGSEKRRFCQILPHVTCHTTTGPTRQPQRSSIQLQRRPPGKGVSLASRLRVGCNSTLRLQGRVDQSPWTGAVAMPRRRLHLLTETLEISSRQ
jgi:hypothetical protein